MENNTHFPMKPRERSGRISVTRERMLPLGTETLCVCYLGKHTIMRPHAGVCSKVGRKMSWIPHTSGEELLQAPCVQLKWTFPPGDFQSIVRLVPLACMMESMNVFQLYYSSYRTSCFSLNSHSSCVIVYPYVLTYGDGHVHVTA